MTAIGFLWFIVTIVVVVGAWLILRWALTAMAIPAQPSRILLVVAGIVGGVVIVAHALRLLGGATLY